MDKEQHIKTERRFPLNLYNKIEERLKNKPEDTEETKT